MAKSLFSIFSIAFLIVAAASCGRRSAEKQESAQTPVVEVRIDNPEEYEAYVKSAYDLTSRKGSGRLWCNNVGRYDEVFNDSNYVQYASAEKMGIDPMYRLRDSYNTRRPLVKIETGENYVVDNLTHSMPYLVPEAASLLDEIGKDFSTVVRKRGGTPGHKVIVTSVLRSPYSVKKLRRVNKNAVDSSTHMFATTFDISWNHFHAPDSISAEREVVLKGILAEVLLKKREEGKCLVKYEKKSPCFHITVDR